MSEGMNKVILFGNLGADPELRYSGAGTPVLSMRLATNESFVDRNREPQERTEWHSIVLWGTRAEAVSRILRKGDGLLIEGSLRTSSYEKDGVRRYRTEVIVRDLRLTGRRPPQPQAPAHAGAPEADEAEGPPSDGALPQEPLTARTPKNGARGRTAEVPALDELPF